MNPNLEQEALHLVGDWITKGAPDDAIPEDPMVAVAAMRLVDAGARRGGHPRAEPRHLRHHLDGARGAAR